MTPPVAAPNAIPPKLKGAGFSASLFFTGVVLALVTVGGGLVVYFFDPSQTSIYPGCTFHRLTGLNCPGCGSTRALYALLHGRWRVAAHDNILFLATLAVLILRAGWMAVNRWRKQPPISLVPSSAAFVWLIVAIIFGVLRNLPPFAFLSP